MVKQASQQGLDWFQNSKFGMFIHWGLYSLLGRGEWVMHQEQIPIPEYEKLALQFNPVKFNADEWVQLAADAGQKYMIITSRHHDGFSMYDTGLSEYKITNSPFSRDPLAELAEACSKNGEVKLGFYVSLLDWHHPAYRFREESGLAWDDYVGFLHGQVRELCTNYGEVGAFFFDGHWPKHKPTGVDAYFSPGGSFEYEKLYGIIRELQPNAVIQNNRHDEPLPGEDIQGFEQDLPGENTVGFNTTEVYDLPIEVCMTINDNWGIHLDDQNHKSRLHLVKTLVKSASLGANYLLNVGPTAEGEILPVHANRLRGIGDWLKIHGEAIYGTSAGKIPLTQETVSTFKSSPETSGKPNAHYVHVLNYEADCVKLKGVPGSLRSAKLLSDGSLVKFKWDGDSLILTISENQRDLINTVIILEE